MSEIISWDQVPVSYLSRIKTATNKRGNPGSRKRIKYLDLLTAFDIETSQVPGRDEAGMYIWQFQIGFDYTVIGRTWDEFRHLLNRLQTELPPNRTLVILVHNLSFEFQFLRTVYQFQPDEVFAMESRRILKCTMFNRRFEFRCTYLHSNMSLKRYLQRMGVEHQKINGDEFDYSKTRFPWTPLSDLELQYCQNDVLGLVEAYSEEMRRDHETMKSVPLTSTGYVRRDAKRAMQMASRNMVHALQPDITQYRLLREAFRGGDVHCNRYFANAIVPNVKSADCSSSYPDVMCNRPFPMTKFRWIDNPNIKNIRYHMKKKHAVCFRVALWDVRMRDKYDGFPYLARNKCYRICRGVYDNGRILCAEYLETTVTDVDWMVIKRQYKWTHIKGMSAMWAHYGSLPRPLIQCAISYYKNKTQLKGVMSEDGSSEYLYAKSKELLNSLY